MTSFYTLISLLLHIYSKLISPNTSARWRSGTKNAKSGQILTLTFSCIFVFLWGPAVDLSQTSRLYPPTSLCATGFLRWSICTWSDSTCVKSHERNLLRAFEVSGYGCVRICGRLASRPVCGWDCSWSMWVPRCHLLFPLYRLFGDRWRQIWIQSGAVALGPIWIWIRIETS